MAGLFRKAKDMLEERQTVKAGQEANRNAYREAVKALSAPGVDVDTILSALPKPTDFKPSDLIQVNDQAFLAIATSVLEDDKLDEHEESNLLKAAEALGVTQERLSKQFSDLLARLVVARVNDGRLPTLDSADVRVPLKQGEVAHLSTKATLRKWQAQREFQGGSHGFSFRIAKGVYYRTGNVRGRSVVVGQQLLVEDQGILTLTSRRAVFSGQRKSLEFDYRKLTDIEVFSDGIKLAVSNRQTPSIFQFETSGEVVAAVINAAAGELA